MNYKIWVNVIICRWFCFICVFAMIRRLNTSFQAIRISYERYLFQFSTWPKFCAKIGIGAGTTSIICNTNSAIVLL